MKKHNKDSGMASASKKRTAASNRPQRKSDSTESESSPGLPVSGEPMVSVRFPVVGIGASAGGLAALESFFYNMPAEGESSLAFVIVQHLDPDHKSILAELIGRSTRMGQDVQKVLAPLIPVEAKVRTRAGRWYLMRILPYRAIENVMEGAVLTFVDIGAQKCAEEQFRDLSAELEQRVAVLLRARDDQAQEKNMKNHLRIHQHHRETPKAGQKGWPA